jgi:hypothetical protein
VRATYETANGHPLCGDSQFPVPRERVHLHFPPDPDGECSPWGDLNDDGAINIFDVVWLAGRYGTTGTPLNKTGLYELEARVDALETRIPQVGYLSMPPAAFAPVDSSWHVLITNYLANYESAITTFVGAVHLPHGAIVTNMTVHWRDIGSQAVMSSLRRFNLTHWQNLAEVDSTGDTGFGSGYDDTIDHATIDNSRFYYYLSVGIPPSGTHLDYQYYYAIIEYHYGA